MTFHPCQVRKAFLDVRHRAFHRDLERSFALARRGQAGPPPHATGTQFFKGHIVQVCLAHLGYVVNALSLDGCEISITPATEYSLAATRVQVNVTGKQPHRHLKDIETIITAADLDPAVQQRAMDVFSALATAEAAVHGYSIEDVHFHEVGAVDAIVDIVGTVFGFHHLGVSSISCSPLPMPRGWVNCEHGELYRDYPDEYSNRVIKFFNENL